MRSLTLLDVSDLELLHLIQDHANGEGWTSSDDIAEALAIDTEYPRRTVGVRISQMRWRYGWVEKHPDIKGLWMLTEWGRRMIEGGDLKASVRTALEKLPPGQRLRAIRAMGSMAALDRPEVRHALRREWDRNLRIIGRK